MSLDSYAFLRYTNSISTSINQLRPWKPKIKYYKLRPWKPKAWTIRLHLHFQGWRFQSHIYLRLLIVSCDVNLVLRFSSSCLCLISRSFSYFAIISSSNRYRCSIFYSTLSAILFMKSWALFSLDCISFTNFVADITLVGLVPLILASGPGLASLNCAGLQSQCFDRMLFSISLSSI